MEAFSLIAMHWGCETPRAAEPAPGTSDVQHEQSEDTVRLRSEIEIDRPVSEVFRFYADEHVRNHPRWDPDVKLEDTSTDPLGVGRVIKRHVTRLGTEVDGQMTIIAFERDALFAVDIQDGPNRMIGRTTFEDFGAQGTRIVVEVDAPTIADASMRDAVQGLMLRSLRNIKRMLEEGSTPRSDPQTPHP